MSGWDDALAELREPFVRGSLERLDRMAQLLDLLEARPDDLATLEELVRHFHGLGGAGTAYGFPTVTALGRQGEAEADARRREGKVPAASVGEWRELVSSIHRALTTAGQEEQSPSAGDAEEPAPAAAPSVLVVDDESDDVEPLLSLLEKEGLSVRLVRSLAAAREALAGQLPDAAIVDLRLPDGSGLELVREVREAGDGLGPVVIMISVLGEFTDKVEAIRAGADGYYQKPLDAENLLRRLHHLLESPKVDPPRVLYVEDEPDHAAYVKAVLEPAGYQVRVCEDPKRFDVELQSFRPDLLLVDVLLPSIRGTELVRYVRQDEARASLPVVFLTGASQLPTRIESARAGGDDYLAKPVPPALLLSTIAARLERARFLRTLLHHDGLTRALTHTAFIEKARALVAAARRTPRRPCVLVMLDLDRFKSVNDTHGHRAGDEVLVSLMSLLRRRLRRTDTVGRYGGEAFGLLLEDVDEREACALLDRLREEFSRIEHRSPQGGTFRVTFSAGCALLDPVAMDFPGWYQAADEALYAAKDAGRDCVRCAQELPPGAAGG